MLVIGFGRFGQIVSQYLLAEEVDVTAIDSDPEMIQVAGGSASRSITATARGSTCCARRASTGAADRDLRRQPRRLQPHRRPHRRRSFPAPRFSRARSTAATRCSFWRRTSTTSCARPSSSANKFGRKTLEAIGIDPDRAAIVEDFIRTRDRDRIAIQQAEGIYAGIDLLRERPQWRRSASRCAGQARSTRGRR